MKDLMSFLNQLGANVRNHMSPIEDKFVEDARQAFPVAQKQSRLSFLNPNETEAAKKDELKKETPAEKTIKQKPVAAQPTIPAKGAPVKAATAETSGKEVHNQTNMPHQPVARPQPARPETKGAVRSAADNQSPNRVNPPVGNRTGNSETAPVINNFQTDRPKPTEGHRPGMGSQGPNNRSFNNTNNANRPAATGGYNNGGQSGAAARPGGNRPGPGSNTGNNRPGGGSYAGNNRPGGGSTPVIIDPVVDRMPVVIVRVVDLIITDPELDLVREAIVPEWVQMPVAIAGVNLVAQGSIKIHVALNPKAPPLTLNRLNCLPQWL